MRYFKVEMSNGFCGFDDTFLTCGDSEPSFSECFDNYAYAEGGGGLDPYSGEEFDTYDDYVECVEENTSIEEISEEEYNELLEDGYPEF